MATYSDLPPEAIHAALWGSRLDVEFESGRIGTSAFLEQAREACRLRCADEEMVAAYCNIFWPNPDVCALVPDLKPRFRLLLGSNTSELHSRHFCRQFADTFRHFDALVFSHDVGARKPAAAFFEHCLELAGCPAHECLFIDDLPANVAGARACGLHGIVYAKGEDLGRQLSDLGTT